MAEQQYIVNNIQHELVTKTIPATTIYYPERLEDAAGLLSKDLGIERVLPAVDPMSMDRLTLIITSDFA